MKEKGLLRYMLVTGALALAISACGDDDGRAPDPESPASPAATDTAANDQSPDQDGKEGGTTLSGEQEHRVTEETTVDVACDGGGEVKVEAAAEVTLTGDCEDLDIRVDGATVVADQVHDVEIDGSDNQVTIDTIRELGIDGDDNTVDLSSVDEIEVEGSGNTVTYGEGDPEIEDKGTDNSIEQG